MSEVHTPGPWQGCLHLRANADETCGCGYRGGIWSTVSDTMICEIGGPVSEEGADMIPRGDRATQIADHWLIAAAPEMLEALKLAYEALSRPEIYANHPVGLARTVINDAIAKATGQQP